MGFPALPSHQQRPHPCRRQGPSLCTTDLLTPSLPTVHGLYCATPAGKLVPSYGPVPFCIRDPRQRVSLS